MVTIGAVLCNVYGGDDCIRDAAVSYKRQQDKTIPGFETLNQVPEGLAGYQVFVFEHGRVREGFNGPGPGLSRKPERQMSKSQLDLELSRVCPVSKKKK